MQKQLRKTYQDRYSSIKSRRFRNFRRLFLSKKQKKFLGQPNIFILPLGNIFSQISSKSLCKNMLTPSNSESNDKLIHIFKSIEFLFLLLIRQILQLQLSLRIIPLAHILLMTSTGNLRSDSAFFGCCQHLKVTIANLELVEI